MRGWLHARLVRYQQRPTSRAPTTPVWRCSATPSTPRSPASDDHLALGLDAILFTDKLASNKFRPSELDFTPELIGRFSRYEVHLAYERDMPVDQGGLMQQFIYLLGSVSF